MLRDGLTFEAYVAGLSPEIAITPVRHADVRRARAIVRAIAARPVLDPRPARGTFDEVWS